MKSWKRDAEHTISYPKPNFITVIDTLNKFHENI